MKKIVLILFFFGLFAVSSQDNPWERTLRSVSNYKMLKVTVVSDSMILELSEDQYPGLLKATGDFKVLEQPSCRCLPTVKYNVIFTLSATNMLVVQAVPNHWFHAVFFYRGQVLTFLILDENNHFYNAVENIVNPPQEETPEPPMCSECAGMMYIMVIGTCEKCGATTESMAFKYCPACARKKGVCQVCGKKLK